MNKPMSDHLVLSLETLSSFRSGAIFDRTVMWPIRGVHIGMRAIRSEKSQVVESQAKLTSADTVSRRLRLYIQGTHT